jgi:hypothetical protein
MTQLIDKMKVLRKKNSSIKNFTSSGYYNQQGFNQALDKCIALVKAEAAVVGDWEVEFDTKFNNPDSLDSSTPINPVYLNGRIGYLLEDVKSFITTLLATKDRETAEAYKKGFIDGGLPNLPDRPLNNERE